MTAASLKAELLSMSAARPFATWEFGLVLFELAFAGWLFSGRLRSFAWWAATACFGTFATVAAFKLLHGEADCGCFGVIRTPPWVALLIDTTAVVALLMTYRDCTITPRYRSSCFSRLPTAIGYALILVVAAKNSLPLVAAKDFARDGASIADPSRWVGQRFPLLEYIDIGANLSSGEWTAVLYRHGCPLCDEALNGAWFHDAAGGARSSSRIALVELPPYGNAQDTEFSRFALSGRLNRREPCPLPVPVVVLLKEGRVMSVAVGQQSRRRLQEVLGQFPGPVGAARLHLRAKPQAAIALTEWRQ